MKQQRYAQVCQQVLLQMGLQDAYLCCGESLESSVWSYDFSRKGKKGRMFVVFSAVLLLQDVVVPRADDAR